MTFLKENCKSLIGLVFFFKKFNWNPVKCARTVQFRQLGSGGCLALSALPHSDLEFVLSPFQSGTLGFRICSISLSISVRTVLIVFQMLIKEGVSGVSIPEDGIHKLEKEGRSFFPMKEEYISLMTSVMTMTISAMITARFCNDDNRQ